MEGILPKSVIWRLSAGFTAHTHAWLVGSLCPAVAELLSFIDDDYAPLDSLPGAAVPAKIT